MVNNFFQYQQSEQSSSLAGLKRNTKKWCLKSKSWFGTGTRYVGLNRLMVYKTTLLGQSSFRSQTREYQQIYIFPLLHFRARWIVHKICQIFAYNTEISVSVNNPIIWSYCWLPQSFSSSFWSRMHAKIILLYLRWEPQI
jgi:hypothetical protein